MGGRWMVVLGVSVMLAGTACSSDSSTTPAGTPTGATSTTSTSSPSEAGADTADVTRKDTFDLEADDYYFSPSTLTGSAGQALTLHVENDGSATHTFTIDEQDISVAIEPGDEADVDLTFPDSGSVTFYCEFHRASGMEGTLEVA